jgi:hypothetical protein
MTETWRISQPVLNVLDHDSWINVAVQIISAFPVTGPAKQTNIVSLVAATIRNRHQVIFLDDAVAEDVSAFGDGAPSSLLH